MSEGERVNVLYLCDGEGCACPNKCCEIPGGCRHTTDPRHAVNGPSDAPEREPRRFSQEWPGLFVERSFE